MRKRYIEAFGKKQTLKEWAHETGLSKQVIGWRIKIGKTAEEALSLPLGSFNRRTERYDKEIIGQRFYQWVVIEPAGNLNGLKRYVCKCDCGNLDVLFGYSLRCNRAKRCKICRHTAHRGWSERKKLKQGA